MKKVLEIHGISKSFGPCKVLDDITLTIRHGEIVALMGPSGCGKTTLLRIIAGLEFKDEGELLIDGQESSSIDPYHRHVACIFQNADDVFPWDTVYRNISFDAEKSTRHDRGGDLTVDQVVRICAAEVKLTHRLFAKGRTLSGGERQRVSLAQALAARPKLLLADEPLSNLDEPLRDEMVMMMRRFFEKHRMSVLYVTHSKHEAEAVAHRVLRFNEGRLQLEHI